jgi:hypothetical protein
MTVCVCIPHLEFILSEEFKFLCEDADYKAFESSSTQDSSKTLMEFIHTQGCNLDQHGGGMSEYVKSVVRAIAGWCICDSPPDTAHNKHLASVKADVKTTGGCATWLDVEPCDFDGASGCLAEWKDVARKCFEGADNIDPFSEHALVQFFCGSIDCRLLIDGLYVSG